MYDTGEQELVGITPTPGLRLALTPFCASVKRGYFCSEQSILDHFVWLGNCSLWWLVLVKIILVVVLMFESVFIYLPDCCESLTSG